MKTWLKLNKIVFLIWSDQILYFKNMLVLHWESSLFLVAYNSLSYFLPFCFHHFHVNACFYQEPIVYLTLFYKSSNHVMSLVNNIDHVITILYCCLCRLLVTYSIVRPTKLSINAWQVQTLIYPSSFCKDDSWCFHIFCLLLFSMM